MPVSTSSLLKRLAVGLIGQALPEASAFSGAVREAKHGVIASTIAGAFIAAFLMLLCYGLFEYLLYRGMDILPAFAITAVIIGVMAAVSLLVARQCFTRVEHTRRQMEFFPEYGNAGELIEELAAAFLEGFREKAVQEQPAESYERPPEADSVEIIHFSGKRK